MTLTAPSTRLSARTISSLILGRKSTLYSLPRYISVWPFWRPNPLTSVTVMPSTPISPRASFTSSSLNGLMIASTFFIGLGWWFHSAADSRFRRHGGPPHADDGAGGRGGSGNQPPSRATPGLDPF